MTTTPTIWEPLHQANPTDAGNQLNLAVVDIGLGRYVAVWTELSGGPIAATAGHDIVGQIYDAEGNPVGSEFRVNVDWSNDNETNPALASRPGGGFVMVYEDTDASGTSIVVQVYDVDGDVVAGAPISITLDAGADILSSPSVAIQADGSFLVVYERGDGAGDTDIVAKLVAANGTVGAEFDVLDSPDDSTSPEVAALSNGNYVVVFQDESAGDAANRNPEFRIVSSAGVVLGGLNISADVDDQTDVQVAALTGGGFVVVWTEENGDGNGDGIRAAVFDNDGDIQVTAFTVNTPAAGNQTAADVVALDDGGFAVVWHDNAAGLLRGQRFDASGAKVGDEFEAGSLGAEFGPVAALLGDGRFIAGFDQVGGADTDVHVTIFDPRDNVIDGTDANDVITARLEGATVNGLDGDDTLLGQGGDDVLDGGLGDDEMSGRGGNDTYHVDAIGDDVNESAGGGTDHVIATVDHALSANVENLTLTGTAVMGVGNGLGNLITGNALSNTLLGLAGNDTLDGGAGADTMQGGGDNDVYIVDNLGDEVTENAGAGVDLVRSGVDYTLGSNVENLLLFGTASLGTGNGLANVITGNALANTLSGLGGNDTIRGDAGDDQLDGGAGADTMLGGSGNDVYIVDSLGDKALENDGEGVDLVQSGVDFILGAHVENLQLTGTAANGTGNDLGNVITGNALGNTLSGLGGNDSLLGQLGNDRLDGGTGDDSMQGGAGDDAYVVDALGDKALENAGEGVDLVQSGVDFILGAYVENLQLTGTAANGTGNDLGNVITGNALGNTLSGLGGNDSLLGQLGNDRLDGGTGADNMQGGAGDDTYVVDNPRDVVDENPGEGTDRVESSISYTLGATLENLQLAGTALLGKGNALANLITGNDVANRLKGFGGPDTLLGEGGNDRLVGGKGADQLAGGFGKDKLAGKGGKDAFVFDTALGGGNVDKIKGFKSGKDKIWLDEDIFAAIGGKLGKREFEVGRKADDANDHIIFNQDNGKIFYDANGDAAGGKVAFARFSKDVSLGRKDFAMVEDFSV